MCKEWSPYAAHQTYKWVVLDGDIDAVWIESMNTVMDDNKVLTLVSNERIPLTESMRMVFEIHSLKNATPATVSRRARASSTCPTRPKDQERIERLFLYASVWAFGGVAAADKTVDSRRSFSDAWRQTFKALKFPEGGLVFEYYVDPSTGELAEWAEKVPTYEPVGVVQFSSIVVPTADLVSLTTLTKALVERRRPVMFVGSAGTGKTILVREFLRNLPDDSLSATINMNYYTDAQALQRQLEQPIEKRSGKSYGPPAGKSLIYFVDDLNMPFVEEYGTQTPIALMRMHADYNSWYDRTDLGLRKMILDCQYICAMNHKAGSFSVNPRLQRHFTAFGCQSSSEVDLAMIYQSILDNHVGADFPPAAARIAKPLVDATLSVHKEMAVRFLPSAIKFHYNFNMRDLAAVFQGLCASKAQYTRTSLPLARLWMHECARVYADRLVSSTEISRCQDILVDVAKRCLDENPEELFEEPNAWTTFATPTMDDSKVYLPVKSLESLRKTLNDQLKEYNESNPIMNLVLFDQAMMHVVRIARIVGFPRGNALLVGVGGSGKQSLARLASFICGHGVVQVAVTSSYGVSDLKEELKELYRKAGVKPAEPLTFILTDSQIVDERFLVYINDLLASGVIPDLFTRDEYDAIFGQLRNAAKAAGIPDTSDSMMEFFIDRVCHNLHVVLCFSPIGDLFRVRSRKFPGLINCTSIDWFHPWPKDALVSVAQYFLESVDLGTPEVSDNIAHHVAEVHSSVGTVSQMYFESEKRYNYVTPTSFLELINFYKSLLATRREEMTAMITRLDTGLTTLKTTNEDVSRLQADLKVKMLEVDEKKVACDDARNIEERAAGDLALAKPALDAALDAVNCLDKASMTELKSFSKPPAGVDKVDAFKEQLEAFRGEDIDPDIVRRCEPYLADPNFSYEKMKTKSAAAANLCNWAVNIITFNQVYKKVKPLMDQLEQAQETKRAAEKDLAVVEAKLAVIDAALNKLQAQFLSATQEKAAVEKVAKECQERLQLAERLTSGLASEYDRWGLEIDHLRSVEGTLVGDVLLSAAFVSYVGAFGSKFRSMLTKDYWIADLASREIPLTEGIEPMRLLTTEAKTAEWMNEGLPADRISIENGAIITNCNRWPLIIDPQLQGLKWIRAHEEARLSRGKKKPPAEDAAGDGAEAPAEGDDAAPAAAAPAAAVTGITQLQLGEKNWVFKVTEAIRLGHVAIIENLGQSIDAVMDPVLSRAVVRKGRTLFIRMGGEDLEYDPDFRLYLQTRLANPHYKPEIAAQCTLINFIVTEGGLEEQLLAKVVSREQPDLEKQKNELVQAFNRYKIQLKSLEDDLLYKLANAPADILSDVPLIEGLETTKATAAEINQAVIKGKQTEEGINEAREIYRPVAAEASVLYFMLLKLNRIEYSYQYSLASFTTFFHNGMERGVMSDDPKKRVDALLSSVRWTIFQWVSRGLFEKHRLVFLVQLTIGLLQQGLAQTSEDGEQGSGPWAKISALAGYTPEGLAFLLRGPRSGGEDPPAPWVTEAAWGMVQALSSLTGFEKLPSDLEDSAPRFLEWFNAVTPETEKLPLDWRDLDRRPFQKLLVVRCLRPDRLTSALAHFVRNTLPSGANYTDLDADSNSFGVLEQAFDDASPSVPIYFILSPGANVVADVDKLAKRDGMERDVTYHNISLGQGQDIIAREKLETAHRLGHWVILNNVHLMPRWLRDVEKLLDEFQEHGSHAAFRVFLSSDPTKTIPIGILDRSIKLTSDPPSGLKANIKQAFCTFTREDYEELEPRTRGILFGLCHFHAVMLERRKFGPQGTNMHYPFSVGDLTSSASVLRNYMENAPTKVPWDDLRYLFGEIMYGGHIVNDFDRLVCAEYLHFFMRDDMLDEMDMYPYPDVLEHIDAQLEGDSPLAFGFHPNAEIGFRTDQSEQLCLAIIDLSPSASGGGEEGSSEQNVAEAMLQDILEQHRDATFDVENVLSLLDEPGPYHTVFLQECELMNALVLKMISSLEDLDLGFRGELTMSESMEALQEALFLDRVPGEWAKVAYPSIRFLTPWLANLQVRLGQLRDWCAAPTDIPVVTWLSGLFNPESFLTAVMQTTAQAQNLELDKLSVATEVTKKLDPSEFSTPSRDGAYISGLALEGARWSLNSTMLEPSAAGEMTCAMPVINCKAAPSDRVESNVYYCPCYKHLRRGPTYVFSAPLKTKAAAAKWILAGTALIMDVAAK
ncbi:dynein light chain binding protein [Aureococcus anophagefferens]|nr:dynein light chain binding protein [Aureococcus anophagefferens]